MGSQNGDFPDNNNSINGAMYPGYDESLSYANLFNYKDQFQDLTSLDLPTLSPEPTQLNFSSFSEPNPGVDPSDDSDSDDVLKYISQMLMEEDMEKEPCMFHDPLALQAAERPFNDAIREKHPSSPNQHPLTDHFAASPDDLSFSSASVPSGGSFSSTSTTPNEPITPGDSCESHKPVVFQAPPVESYSQNLGLSQSSFGSVRAMDGTPSNGSLLSSIRLPMAVNIFSERDSIMQFQKGMEEASKFLPKNNNIFIDLENMNFPDEAKETVEPVIKKEEEEHSPDGTRVRKIHYREEDDLEEGRSSKHSAVFTEEAELCEMFDRILFCAPMKQEFDGSVDLETEKKGSESGKGRSRKQGNNKSTVDLRTLLILCAQSTASDDRRTADELLKQITEHSSAQGDGSQRLAHYFTNALEARLAGTGSQIYTALSSKRTTAADMIKAYQFFLSISPFKKISVGFVSQMILKAAENKSKLHVIDFGILYGIHWTVLIQLLSQRSGGPPKLCITGIDLPQPGFRPAERVESTGRRLAKYCERFKVPFEYHAIAQKWETIKLEDLKIESDEVVAVNCLYRFKNLLDETIVVDSPRNAVLNLVRSIKPDIFLHGVANGSYNAPFFVTRFREALFHYSTFFDMFDANASREDPERFMFEKEFYGREIMNVVACEGTERVERPETYKQWQVRNQRAGFRQLPLDSDIMGKLKGKVKTNYHKDFVFDVDGQWALMGWKGRITYAISAWTPA